MANEITTSIQVNVLKGNLSINRTLTGQSYTMNGTTYAAAAVSIPSGGTATALDLGAITTAGYAYFRNTDSTHFIAIGVVVSSTFYALLKLKPGEAAVARLATTAIYAMSDTAACILDFMVLND